MTDEDHPDLSPPPSASVPDLIDDYRQEQQAVRLHARELARLRGEVLSAADREAAEIVVTARAHIRRIIVSARHDLLELAEQVQIISGVHAEPDGYDTPPIEGLRLDDAGDPPKRFFDARHEVRRVLEDARPELERLAQQALVVSPHAPPPAAADAPPVPDVESTPEESSTHGIRPAMPVPSDEAATTRPRSEFAEEEPRRAGHLAKGAVAVLALIGAIVLVGTFWWTRSGRVVTAPQQPAPSAQRGSPRPRVEPSVATPLAAAEPQASQRASLLLRVTVQRPTWMRTTIDGRTDAGAVIQVGTTKEIAAEREVSLRVGDAGAVRVSLNGAEAAPVGRDGEVVTRRFALDQPVPSAGGSSTAPNPGSASAPAGTLQTEDRGSHLASAPGAIASAAASAPPVSAAGSASAGRSLGPPSPANQTGAGVEPMLTSAASRWLDAYYRQDAAAMAALANGDTKVSDERTVAERPPAALGSLGRTLERVSFQFVGDSAILSARVTERIDAPAPARTYVSWLSQLWFRESGQWQLIDVRIVSDVKLK